MNSADLPVLDPYQREAVEVIRKTAEILDVDITTEFNFLSLLKAASEIIDVSKIDIASLKNKTKNNGQGPNHNNSNNSNGRNNERSGNDRGPSENVGREEAKGGREGEKKMSESTNGGTTATSQSTTATTGTTNNNTSANNMTNKGKEKNDTNDDNLTPYLSEITRFKTIVESERQKLKAQGITGSSSTPWLRIDVPNQSSFYYNFKDNTQSWTLPGTTTREGPSSALDLEDSVLDVMSFTSSWVEMGRRKHMTVKYFLHLGGFEVKIEGIPEIFRIKEILGKHGPISCWDLHVGFRLTILGKLVTLQSCDFVTKQWLEASARRLLKAKQRLESILLKYERLPIGPDFPTLHPSGLSTRPLYQVSLRKLMLYIALIRQRISIVRPALVSQLDL